jgi:hypothetical protein
MAPLDIRPVRGPADRYRFVDFPFRLFKADPGWVPPLRLTVYDRLSRRHPANQHQEHELWMAYRSGKPVARIGACVDHHFNRFQGLSQGWVGFFDAFDDPEAAHALFGAAWRWLQSRDMTTAVGPASFTTNDEVGLLVEGFVDPPTIMTLQNPPYYEGLWVEGGWQPAMDLWGWRFDRPSTALSDRQRRTLQRLRERSRITIRDVRMEDWEAEVGRFFEIYNASWQHNWGFAPMPEAEIRHLGRQLKQILDPRLAFGAERDGRLVAVCLALPDANEAMRKVRNGRLFPYGWWPLLRDAKRATRVRILVLGVRPEMQTLALGPLMYAEIVDRIVANPRYRTGEASWTLATNDNINTQMASMGATRSKVWRLYQHQL